jgi:hypothetical protein
MSDSLNWRRSARCVSDHHCVEVAEAGEDVLLRNSTRPEVSLHLTRDQWRGLIRLIRAPDWPN